MAITVLDMLYLIVLCGGVQGAAAIGIVGKDCVVLAVEKVAIAKLQVPLVVEPRRELCIHSLSLAVGLHRVYALACS